MLAHHLKIIIRNLRKHPLYTFINVFGLAVGLTCCAFITLYILDETSYERFHERAEHIVRIAEDEEISGRLSRRATSYGPLAPALEAEVPLIEKAVRVLPYSLLVSRSPEQRYQEDGILFVDSTFFEVFSFELLRGDPESALDAPFAMVITPSAAARYFGDEDPVGATLQIRDDEESHSFTVSGIVQEPPSNSHIQFDFLASFSGVRTLYGDWIDDPRNWEHPPLYTYALLRNGTDIHQLEALLPEFAQRQMGPERAASRSLRAEKLTHIRLFSHREQELTPTSNIAYIYFFGLVAFFTLLIACINFMNLATASAVRYSREVGIRKALGASRSQVIRRFLSESIVLVGLSGVVVATLVVVLLPLFNELSGKAVSAGLLRQASAPLISVIVIGVVGILAGSYPAFYVSGFKPTRVLKGVVTGRGSPAAATLRTALVVVQFAISTLLIVGTVVLYRQLDYVSEERLGFDKEHVVLVPLRDLDNQFHHETLKDTWKQIPGVRAVTASSGMPGLAGGIYDWWVRPAASTDSLTLMALTVDHDYVDAYGLEIIDGRNFSEASGTDASQSFLLNESAARKLGWSDPVGRELTLGVWFRQHVARTGTVIGVVKDFQYRSLRHEIEPIIFHILPRSWYYDYLSVRLRPENPTETLSRLEDSWLAYNPDRPFEYSFLDDQFDALYRSETRLSNLVAAFAAITIIIACLGLFGLAAFTVEQRTKEIGVRKVLGASAFAMASLLSRDLLKPTVVACAVSMLPAYFLMIRWLETFADQVEIGPDVFLLAAASVLVLATFTVSVQSVRAARADPVRSLRHE